MREILFRGKAINDNWYYGFPLIFTEDCVFMTAPHTYNKAVIPESVSEFTGLTDKNGTKIFEGDIVKFSYDENDENPTFYSIEWKSDRACFGYAETADKMLEIDAFHCEVIGNIHDNPELLKEYLL
jgi:uncharacterized phage protein (TIGR01671 family)